MEKIEKWINRDTDRKKTYDSFILKTLEISNRNIENELKVFIEESRVGVYNLSEKEMGDERERISKLNLEKAKSLALNIFSYDYFKQQEKEKVFKQLGNSKNNQ